MMGSETYLARTKVEPTPEVMDDGASPLLIAACEGHLATVRFLAAASADPYAADAEGALPIHAAGEEGSAQGQCGGCT